MERKSRSRPLPVNPGSPVKHQGQGDINLQSHKASSVVSIVLVYFSPLFTEQKSPSVQTLATATVIVCSVSPQWSQLCQSAASRNRCLWGSRLSWAVWRRRASPSLGTSGSRTWRRSPMTQRPVSSSSTPHTRSVQKQELWLVLVCACARTRADMSAKGGAAGTVAWRRGVEADILGRQLMAWEGLSHEGNLLSSFAHSSILSCFTAQRRCDTRSPFVFKWTYWTTVL